MFKNFWPPRLFEGCRNDNKFGIHLTLSEKLVASFICILSNLPLLGTGSLHNYMEGSVRNAVELYLLIRICPSSPFPFPWRFRSIRSFPSFLAFFLPQTERRRVCHPLLAFPSRLPRLPWAARAICCMAPGAKSQKTHPGPACALPFLVHRVQLACNLDPISRS